MNRRENDAHRWPQDRASFVYILLMIALNLALGPWCEAAAEPVGQARVYKKVGDRELRLFVVNPDDWKAADRRPALVLFHGGGWTGGTGRIPPGQGRSRPAARLCPGCQVRDAVGAVARG